MSGSRLRLCGPSSRIPEFVPDYRMRDDPTLARLSRTCRALKLPPYCYLSFRLHEASILTVAVMTHPTHRQSSACRGLVSAGASSLTSDHPRSFAGRPARLSDVKGAPGATPAVVLADASPGREFDVLGALLEEALGLTVLRIRITEPPTSDVSFDLGERCLTIGGQRVRPVVVWVRHAVAGAVHSHQVRTIGAAGYGLQGAECWAKLLNLLTAAGGAALPGRAPGFARQLVDAGQHGVRVPRTVVGTDVGAAMRILSTRRAVVKVPDARLLEHRPDARETLTPRVIGSADGPPEWMDGSFPAVVQEYVEHASEHRVYYADGGVFAFEVDKPAPESLWTDPARVTVRPARCPERLADIVRSLSRAWGLRYGAFDFLITCSNEPVFLEVNADGDWLWFERRAGSDPVSFMVTAMVAELYLRVSRAEVV
jgi:hypothetical protein